MVTTFSILGAKGTPVDNESKTWSDLGVVIRRRLFEGLSRPDELSTFKKNIFL